MLLSDDIFQLLLIILLTSNNNSRHHHNHCSDDRERGRGGEHHHDRCDRRRDRERQNATQGFNDLILIALLLSTFSNQNRERDFEDDFRFTTF
ncbi:MAG: hypothetical protein FWE22_03520 [Firmicutes bacterium]|nr:hypothetical protein [Bacillota bacterium]